MEDGLGSGSHRPVKSIGSANPVDSVNKRRQQKPFREVLLSGFAGGIAGCVAKTSVAPLDRIKILFQTGKPQYMRFAGSFTGAFKAAAEIYENQGARGLFQGHSMTLARIYPYAAIKYMAYDIYHTMLMPTQADETNLRLFTAGALCGVTSVFLTYPLDLLRVRLAFEHKNAGEQRVSIRAVASKIYNETAPSSHGSRRALDKFPILKFYRGYVVSIMGIVPYGGVSFLVWGRLQNAVRQTAYLTTAQRRKYRTLLDLASGAAAGALSQTASYPFEVIRRRMQVGGLIDPGRLIGFRETVARMYAKNGWRSFFVGLSIGYLKIVPMTALSFTTWVTLKRALQI